MSQANAESDRQQQGLGSRIHAHVAALDGVELDLPPRQDPEADLIRRARTAALFLQGEWSVELETYEVDQERERLGDQELTS
jgi:hypothetical protein